MELAKTGTFDHRGHRGQGGEQSHELYRKWTQRKRESEREEGAKALMMRM